MTRNEEGVRTAGRKLQDAQRILLISHLRPDGDAIGSLLGLGLALEQAGKEVQMVLVDGVPQSLRFMEGSRQIVRQPKGSFDLRVVLDCSDLLRTGIPFESENLPDLNIDHHITNLNFARVNLVEPEAVATSAVLASHLPEWGFSISEPVAKVLLTGIVSDTLGFRTSNTTAQALRLAADLMDRGADLANLYNLALMRRSMQAARFWAAGLEQLQRENRLIWTTLRLEDRNRVNYSGNDDADLINFLATIDESDIAVIFVEQKEGSVKVSWRGQPGWDVSQIALHFGGGGHPGAAGAMIDGPLEQVQEQVIHETLASMQNGSTKNGNDPAA